MRPVRSVLLAALAALPLGAAPGAAPDATGPTLGLAFALTTSGTGAALASGPYLLGVPGADGPLRLELSRLSVEGARLRGEARLRNDSRLLLSSLSLDFRSTAATGRDASGGGPGRVAPLSLRRPLAFGDLLPGESSEPLAFEVAPLPGGEGVALVTLLGAVSGLSVEPRTALEDVVRPVGFDTDRAGRLYVAVGGVGRVLRFSFPGPSRPAEAARTTSPPAGVAVRRRNGDLHVSTGGRFLEVWRSGRTRPGSLDAGRPVTTLRFDAKGVLRAASGNAVLAFDEAKPGAATALGPEGSVVLSFDADARGALYGVVREGEARRLVSTSRHGPVPFGPASPVDVPVACRFDSEDTLWLAGASNGPEGAVLSRLDATGSPLAALSRLALTLLLGVDEDAAVPGIVDLAPGPASRLHVLLEDGSVFAVRPF